MLCVSHDIIQLIGNDGYWTSNSLITDLYSLLHQVLTLMTLGDIRCN